MKLQLKGSGTAAMVLPRASNRAARRLLKAVVASLIVAVAVGWIAGAVSPLIAAASLGAVLFVFISVRRTDIGILVWILVGGTMLIPVWTVRNAGIYPSVVLLSLLLLFWIFSGMATKGFHIPKSKLTAPIIALAIAAVISGLQGGMLYDPNVPGVHRFVLVQIFAASTIVLSCAAALLVARFIRTYSQIRWLYLALIVLAIETLVLLRAGVGFVAGWDMMIIAPAVSLAYANVLFGPRKTILKKVLCAAFVLFLLTDILYNYLHPEKGQWISGWLAWCVPLVFITFLKSRKIGLIVLLFVVLLMAAFQQKFIQAMVDRARGEGDYARFGIWTESARIWWRRPLLGVGPGNYIDYSRTYARREFAFTSSHGQYFQLLAETGIVSLLLFIWLVVRFFKAGMRLFKNLQDPFLKIFVVGIMGSFAGQLLAGLVGDYILPSYHNAGHRNFCITVYNWILIGALISIEIYIRRQQLEVSVLNQQDTLQKP